MTTTLDSPPTNRTTLPKLNSSAGPAVPGGQSSYATQAANASGASNSLQPTPSVTPKADPAAGLSVVGGHHWLDTELTNAVEAPNVCSDDQVSVEDQGRSVVAADPTSPPGHSGTDTQGSLARRGPILADAVLGILAATVDDLEGVRKATANRYRQLTRVGLDEDGKRRGLGLPESAPEVAIVRALLSAIAGEKLDGSGGVEHAAILKLNLRMRHHPLWKTWGVHQKGVGEKQLARLLSAIGDPYWNDLHDRPRTVSELWAYCGLHVVHSGGRVTTETQVSGAAGVAPRKVRGSKVNWSGDARMRVWNISGSCLKAQAGYADVYYAAREKYAEATHSADCVRCGPAGKPALAGSPLSDGHKHARALRIVSKEILRDLWLAAKALHEAE